MSFKHAEIEGSRRVALSGAKSTGRANSNLTIEVSLKLRRKAALPPLQSRPIKALTREQLEATYGASNEDIKTVTDTFTKLGLKVVRADPATRTVRLSGNVAAMETAFGVKLFNYTSPRGNYRGRVGLVSVPLEVKPIIEGVFGLDNRRVVKRRRPPVAFGSLAGQTTVPSSWYVPSELATHYNFPPGDGSGQTVGVLEFGGGYFPSDLTHFCKLAGVSVPQVTAVSTDGTPTNSKDGAEGEVMLDIEVIAGVCPKAHIVAYFAQWTEQGWITIVDAAVHDANNDPSVLSISWGEAEDTDIWTAQAMTQVDQTFQEAALLGISVCCAAGDDGSSDAISDGLAHLDFPGSSPSVLSVGGTTIPSKTGTGPDIGWKEGDGLRSDNGGSTGGGVSTQFARPVWQQNITIQSINPGSIVGRCAPDVAANADWDASPYLLFVDGSSQPNGGTSAATPLWAALIALMNEQRGAGNRVGFLSPVLYQAVTGGGAVGATGCTDVVAGDNTTASIGGYQAGPGYDAVSGWGTPNGVKLASELPA